MYLPRTLMRLSADSSWRTLSCTSAFHTSTVDGAKVAVPQTLHYLHSHFLWRFLHASVSPHKKKNILEDALPPTRVREIDIKVQLLDGKGEPVGVMRKIDALEKAKKMNLRAVNVALYPALQTSLNRKSVYPIYMLFTGNALHEIQLQDRERRKSQKVVHEKVLQLTSTATDHDIQTKINQAEDWLRKGDEVRVLILGRPDLKGRMAEIHDRVLAKLKAMYKPNIPDLSKSDRSIKFRLIPITAEEGSELTDGLLTDVQNTGT